MENNYYTFPEDNFDDWDESFHKTTAEKTAERLVNNPSVIEKAVKRLYQKAKDFVENPEKLERLLQRSEKKLQSLPTVTLPKLGEVDLGEKLSVIPTLGSLLRSYLCKEYTALSRESIIITVAGILYFVSPLDLIPDWIPVFGLVDDALVIKFCLSHIAKDVEAYREWRRINGKEFIA